jgi:UDP-3-O-[3-hydroxymyristoyl] glucosamine N-acyltransferase
MQITAKELAQLLKGTIEGNPDKIVCKLSKIEEADADSLCFIANPKYDHCAADTKAGIVVINYNFSAATNKEATFIKVDDAYASFAFLLAQFSEKQKEKTGIDAQASIARSSLFEEGFYLGPFSVVGENVKIGKNVKIYPNSYVGDNCTIGDNTIIYSGVNIYHNCSVGSDCIIHSGVVIGSDGFGFAPKADGSFEKIPQTGNVTIGNFVEIGANTVIDRATLGSTNIKDGVKIDNLVQIAHNVELGENTVVASQAGISGSTKLGRNVMVGGQAGFVGHIQIADFAKINAQSGVSKSIETKGAAVSGSPAENFRQHYRHQALLRQLPEIMERLTYLENKLKNNL